MPQPDIRKIYGDALKAAPNVSVYLKANVVDIELNDSLESAEQVSVKRIRNRGYGAFMFLAGKELLTGGDIPYAKSFIARTRSQPLPARRQRDAEHWFFVPAQYCFLPASDTHQGRTMRTNPWKPGSQDLLLGAPPL